MKFCRSLGVAIWNGTQDERLRQMASQYKIIPRQGVRHFRGEIATPNVQSVNLTLMPPFHQTFQPKKGVDVAELVERNR